MEIKIDKIEKLTVYELNNNTITFQTGDILEIKTKNKVYKGKFLGRYSAVEYGKVGYADKLTINLDCSTEYCSDIEVIKLDNNIESIRVLDRSEKVVTN